MAGNDALEERIPVSRVQYPLASMRTRTSPPVDDSSRNPPFESAETGPALPAKIDAPGTGLPVTALTTRPLNDPPGIGSAFAPGPVFPIVGEGADGLSSPQPWSAHRRSAMETLPFTRCIVH